MSDPLPPPWFEQQPPPPCLGSPANELGVPVVSRVLLARTEAVAVVLMDIVVFSSGVEFQLYVRGRPPDGFVDPFGVQSQLDRGERPEDILRFGLVFSDGSRVSSVDDFPLTAEPDPPLLIGRGGGGDLSSWSSRYWLWPLPPPGVIGIVLEWRAKAIAPTRVPLDSAPLLEAAARCEKLWPDGPDEGRPRLIYDSLN
jgi:hypothetical protein